MEVHPVTPDRWPDLAKLFGSNGAYSNCWCTWWILSSKEFSAARPGDRRTVLQDLVRADQEPGLLAYRQGVPVGWCAVGPRARFKRMMSPRSRVYGPVGEPEENWVVNCFFISRPDRGQGIATALLEAAVEFSRQHRARSLDGYPLINTAHGAASLYVGTLSMFQAAGFREIARNGDRPLMRIEF